MRIRLLPCLAFSLLLMAALISCSTTTEKAKIAAIQGIVTVDDTDTADPLWSTSTTLVEQLPAEPDNLHPTNGTSGQRSELFGYIHRFLVSSGAGNGLAPDLLLQLPDVSADGRTYQYRLKAGITWDDGQPLTAEDVLFTCKVNLAAQTHNPAFKPYWSNLEACSIDSGNPLAFSLTMKSPHCQNTSFLSSFPILQRSYFDPENRLAKYSIGQLSAGTDCEPLQPWFDNFNSDELGRSPKKISGLGAYAVVDWTPGVSILLQRKKPVPGAPEQLLFKIAKDENSIALDLKNQVYDVTANLSMTTFLQLAADAGFQKNYHCILSPTYNYSYLCFNTRPDSTRPAIFSDRAVRKAVAQLISVDRITAMLYQAYSTAARPMASNVSPFKAECDTELHPVTFDPQSARQQLAAAGWKDVNRDGLLEKGQQVMDVELLYLNSSPDWKDMAGLISQQLADAGIRVTPVGVDQPVFLERARSHRFDLLLGSFGGSSSPEDYAQLWSTSSWTNHGSNYSGFGSEYSDSLIKAINVAANDSVRFMASHRLQRVIREEQPMLFLYTSLRRNILHKRWGKIRLFPDRPGMNLSEFRLIPPRR